MAARRHLPAELETARSLAVALLTVSTAPVLLLDSDLTVIAASTSFCQAFQLDPDAISGRELSELGAGEWRAEQLASLLEATASGHSVDAHEMDLDIGAQGVRRLVLNARKLAYGDEDHPLLSLTVSDVTEARLAEKLKDDLLRDKAILLQEMQHRVANSLQIIASALLQSARKVQSDESRTYLLDAHSRVISVASVQRLLAPARRGEVELLPYFTDLCRSLGAAMIGDHDQLSLEVTADGSTTKADVSVSLGLIVTELVINALKHAFPGGRRGRILVDYRSLGPAWTLSVGDDGVGFPEDARAGLGTGIVEALVSQLEADLHVVAAHPGTAVSVVHA